jgi:spore coat polysaccharide biosynthesis protein SpsF
VKTVILVQARMTSTRLPGKVLKEVLGKPLLEYQIERLRRIENADEIVIATTVNDSDQPIVDLCNRLSVSYFRGLEEDVLSRYYEAAKIYKANNVVRITSDCPVIDPTVCDEAITCFLKNQDHYDYVRIEQYPRGLDVEVFSFKILEECFRKAMDKADREHVTRYIYRHPERYRVKRIYCSQDYSQHRWTVDTPEDFALIKRIIEELYPVKKEYNFADILNVMEDHPDWYEINAMVRQKKCGE